MKRRGFLRLGGAVALGGSLAGCLAGPTASHTNALGLATPTFEGDWPRFGFDDRNTRFAPDTAGPRTGTIHWQFDTGSPTTLCSPVVSGGTVYSGSTGDPGDLFALDAHDGSLDWRFSGDGYFRATPTVTADTVYAGTFGKSFSAIDRETGDERWSVDVGHRFDAASALVVDDLVIAGTIGEAPLALTAENGDQRFEDGAVVALDAGSGTERWRYDTPGAPSGPGKTDGEDVTGSPAAADGVVYVGSSWGRVVALDPADGTERWSTVVGSQSRSAAERPHLSGPVVANGLVYVSAFEDRRVYALDADTGREVWTADLGGAPGQAPAVTPDTVYVGSYRTGGCLTSAVCLPGSLGGPAGTLHALDVASGAERWTAPLKPTVRSAPAVTTDQVFVANGDRLTAIDRHDGTHRWDVPISERVRSSPAVAGGMVFVDGWYGTVYGVGPA